MIKSKEEFANACDAAQATQGVAKAVTPTTHDTIFAITLALAATIKECAKPGVPNTKLADGIHQALVGLLDNFDEAAADIEKRAAAGGDAKAVAMLARKHEHDAQIERNAMLSAESDARDDPARRYFVMTGNDSVN